MAKSNITFDWRVTIVQSIVSLLFFGLFMLFWRATGSSGTTATLFAAGVICSILIVQRAADD